MRSVHQRSNGERYTPPDSGRARDGAPGALTQGDHRREGRDIVSDSSGRTQEARELLAARVRVPQHVVFREFPAETVVLNLQTEQYHGLNPTAGVMLTELGRSASVAEASAAVARRFGRSADEVRGDVLSLCAQLLDRGLIEIVPADS